MTLALLAHAIATLPWRSLRSTGGAVGLLVGSVLRIRRAHVEASMRRAGLSRVPSLARAMYASLGTSLCEFLWLLGRGAPPRSALVLSARARDIVSRYGKASGCASRRGLVIATAHTGNWDLVACALGREHIDLSIVTKRLSSEWLDRFWQERRASFGLELFDGIGVFARAAAAVRRGRAVAMLIDQAPERKSAVAVTSFLGASARCDASAALLAARTGAPLVLALSQRLPDGRHAVDVPLVLQPPSRPSRIWVDEATRTLNAALERFVMEHPSQWLWMHRRWKTAGEAEVAADRASGVPSSRGPHRELAGTSPVC